MPTVSTALNPAASPDWAAIGREKVAGLRFGFVPLVVYDGRVTQIERSEKTRRPASREALTSV